MRMSVPIAIGSRLRNEEDWNACEIQLPLQLLPFIKTHEKFD